MQGVKWKLPEWWGVEDKHPQWNVLPGGWTAFKIQPISDGRRTCFKLSMR
jgi:hypothetical protein